MFGDKVGFVNLKAITTKDGFNLPSYVFLRGGAVSILMFVNNKILVI
jgi:ADP-sugar diphosphatase